MSNAFQIGLQLAVLGMGLVFLLLALLWALMAVLVKLDRAPRRDVPAERLYPAERLPAERPRAVAGAGVEPEKLAAIMIAVKLHQAVRRKQAAPAMRDHLSGSLSSRWMEIGRARQNQNWSPRRPGGGAAR